MFQAFKATYSLHHTFFFVCFLKSFRNIKTILSSQATWAGCGLALGLQFANTCFGTQEYYCYKIHTDFNLGVTAATH